MSIVKLVAALWVAAAIASAADYCSLVVEVNTPNGKRQTANVTVVEQNGRKLYDLAVGRDARFCDLGLLPVTVKVGSDGTCNQVVVNSVPLAWLATYHLKVTYDASPCLQESPHLLRFCTYLFRISDGADKWIPGATVQVSTASLALRSDDSGRARVDASIGPVTVTIGALGYATQVFNSTCTPDKAAEPQEEPIRLSRK